MLLILLLFSSSLHAQETSYEQQSIGLQSPTASSLGQYGEIPVNLYTGIPKINVPIYNISYSDLSLPVNLSYHASGVEVEKLPGWVGLGWALNAGGVITRTKKGLPDDHRYGYYYTGEEVYNRDLDESYLKKIKEGRADGEPDLFYFNFAGKTGKFVLGTKKENHISPIPYQKMDIEILDRSTNQVESWKITTVDGTKYFFEAQELTQNMPNKETTQTQPYISSWYLTKIESATGEAEISFSYTQAFPPVNPTHKARTLKSNHVAYGCGGCSVINPFTQTYMYYSVGSIFLERVKFGENELIFLSDSEREDFAYNYNNEPIERKLTKIKLFRKGEYQKSWIFKTGYFNQKSNDPAKKRLRLNSVYEVGRHGTRNPGYVFNYNEKISLPSRYSKAVDHWGYFNGKDNDDVLPEIATTIPHDNELIPIYKEGANRRVDEDFLTAGMLTEMRYPTGGWTRFEYEGHKYGIDASGIKPNEVQQGKEVKEKEEVRVEIVDGMPVDGGDSSDPFEGADKTKTISIPFKQTVTIEFSLRGEWMFEGDGNAGVFLNSIDLDSDKHFDFIKTLGAQNGSKGGTEKFELWPGTYQMRAYGDPPGAIDVMAYISVEYRKESENGEKKNERLAGGVRVKKIVHNDGLDSKHKVKEFDYTMREDPGRSSGVLISRPRYLEFHSFPDFEFNFLPDRLYVLKRFSYPTTPLGITQGSHIGYKEVTVNKYSSNDTVSVRHRFTAPDKYQDILISLSHSYQPLTRISKDWKRGKLLSQEHYRADGELIVQNSYKYKDFLGVSRNYRGLKVHNIGTFSFPNDGNFFSVVSGDYWYKSSIQNGGLTISAVPHYYIESDWYYRSLHKKKVISPETHNAIGSRVKFVYGDDHHMQITKKVETNSDGGKRITNYTYAHQKYPEMKKDHMLSQPYKVTVKNGDGEIQQINWTLWEPFDVTGDEVSDFWHTCGKWTGGPGLGTDAPNCNK